MIQHTYIEVFGLQLADPLTFISDVLMSVVAFYCGHKIFHAYSMKYAKYVGLFFFFLGASSLIGGTSHLLDIYFGKTPHIFAWTVQGISIIFIELASVKVLSRKTQTLLRMFIYAFFGVFITKLLSIQHFDVVKVNATVGLIGFTLGFHTLRYFQYREKVFLKVPFAICCFIIPALMHGSGIQINAWLNQNVLSHLALLPCYYLLYKGSDGVAQHLAKTKIPQAQQ